MINYRIKLRGASVRSEYIKEIKSYESKFKTKTEREYIRKFMTKYCHFLTKEVCEKLSIKKVALFYLKNSDQIIHSAAVVDDNQVIDGYGKRAKGLVLEYYNKSNLMFGNGDCDVKIIDRENLVMDDFYLIEEMDIEAIKDSARKWINHLKNKNLI